MRFLRLLKRELDDGDKSFWIFMVISALSGALILAVINMVIMDGTANETFFAGVFVLLLLIFVFVQYKIYDKGWKTAEKIADGFRRRLAAKILSADMYKLEQIGDAEVMEKLTQESANVSQSAGFLIPSIQSIILLIFVMLYLGIIFPIGMAVFAILLITGIYLYRYFSKRFLSILKRATLSEVRFYSFINDILKGIKELKLFRARKLQFLADVNRASSFLRKLKHKSLSEYSDLTIYSQSFFFLLIGVAVFVIPKIEAASLDSITKLVTAAFFIMGPMLGIIFMLPMFEKIDLSLEYLETLEAKLESISEVKSVNSFESTFREFNTISLKGIKFSYSGLNNNSFEAGPVDLEISKGEILFFTGGNGSGKTTLLKVISTIYSGYEGDIIIDETLVGPELLDEYRNIFSAIFSDFHLFAKLYGFEKEDKKKITELLESMKIENKTAYENDSFTNLNLSTGQKKRLALAVSLLEDRPIIVFDEWAAEQDEYFRKYFYENILPELKNRGKTILVVSHDERYFNVADKIVKMDFGKIVEIIRN